MTAPPSEPATDAGTPRPVAEPRPRPAPATRPVVRPSTVTLKTAMALTGTVFALFVLVHMIGNLKVYTGAEHFDAYAHWLRTLLGPLVPYEGVLWILRVALAACLVAHVAASALLVARARRARGPRRRTRMPWTRIPATLMPYTGLVLLVFVVVHVLDLTTGTAPVAGGAFEPTTVERSHAFHNLVESFSRPGMALFYAAVMLLLGLHLVQGLWSVAHDLGANGRRARRVAAVVALVVASVVTVGNLSIPLAVLTGVLS